MSKSRWRLGVAGGLVGAVGVIVAMTIVIERGSPPPSVDDQLDGDAEPVSEWVEPRPEMVGDGIEVDHDGASVGFAGMEVVVPAGAIGDGDGDGDSIVVSEAVSTDPDALTEERIGPVVHVDHDDASITAPIEIWWDLSRLDDIEAATAMPVRWDPDVQQWRPVNDDTTTVVHDDGELRVATTEFSFLTWISDKAANAGQTLGEIIGSRTDAPTCSDEELPPWVRQVVRPDEDLRAAALRTCTEPDKDGVITARVTNNRTFTQQLQYKEGHQQFAWIWRGPDRTAGLEWILYDLALDLFDDDARMLVPPTAEVAFGVQRPQGGGQVFSVIEADVTATTLLVDIVVYLIGKVSIGGFDDETLVGRFVTGLYECGGREVAAVSGGWDGVVGAVVAAVASCSTEILRPGGPLRDGLEDAVRNGRIPADLERRLHRLGRLSNLVTAAEIAHYLSDHAAHALTGGNPTISFRLDGKPGRLGAWNPTCADLRADSNRLYRNLALQDTFSDKSRELWEFDEWIPSARVAVEPLGVCPNEYVSDLADLLPDDWGDALAAQQVAGEMRLLIGDDVGALDVEERLMNAEVPPLCGHEGGNLVNGELPEDLIEPLRADDGHLGWVGLVEAPEPLHADIAGTGSLVTVAIVGCFQTTAPGILYGEPALVLYATSGEMLDFVEISSAHGPYAVESLRVTGDGQIAVSWVECLHDIIFCPEGDTTTRDGFLTIHDGSVELLPTRTPDGLTGQQNREQRDVRGEEEDLFDDEF